MIFMPGRMNGMYLARKDVISGNTRGTQLSTKSHLRYGDVLRLNNDRYDAGTTCKEWQETIRQQSV